MAISASQGAWVVRCGILAYGATAFAPDLRALRAAAFPGVEENGNDTEFFGEFGDWSA